jgi:Uma2 family endonuclease
MSQSYQGLDPSEIRPLKRLEYDRLVELGCYEDERVELLDGMVVQMSPQDARHSAPIRWLNMRLVPALAGRALVQVQLPLALGELSEPEPDISIVPLGDYRTQHPTTALLIIEVALSSMRKDRQLKRSIYARAAIPEFWLIDVKSGTLEVFRAPENGEYRQARSLSAPAQISPEAFPDLVISVAEILGLGT